MAVNSLAPLKALLSQATSDLAKRGFNALAMESCVDYHVTEPVATKEIREIYSRRARLNSRKSGSVEGFEELLPSLNKETDSELLIHAFETDREAFTVFTDVAMTKLMGLLISHMD